MQVAVIEEDLQFIAQILQEQLRAEIPSGEFFQVKCAVKNDQLLILTQHPQGVSADTDNIFAVLEEALRSLLNHHGQRVEIFLRITGVKLPYAKYSLVLQGLEAKVDQAAGEEEKIDNSSPFTTSDSLVDDQSPTNTPNEPEDRLFDPNGRCAGFVFLHNNQVKASDKADCVGCSCDRNCSFRRCCLLVDSSLCDV
ncbi:MAG: hypothetical protein KatS3mg066_0309 [Fischerella sp.]|nr:MAG: hypothetical protein KatS3mg066_0309 [Fischerella sp.]